MNINHNHDLLIVTCSLRRSITIHIPSQWGYDFKSVIGNVDMTRASIWDIRDMRCGAVSKVHVASNKDLPPLSCWGPMMTASAPLHDQAKGQVLHLHDILCIFMKVFMSLCLYVLFWSILIYFVIWPGSEPSDLSDLSDLSRKNIPSRRSPRKSVPPIGARRARLADTVVFSLRISGESVSPGSPRLARNAVATKDGGQVWECFVQLRYQTPNHTRL